jgi:hypothetical protein
VDFGLRGARKMNGALERVEPDADRALDRARSIRLIALAVVLAAVATVAVVLV